MRTSETTVQASNQWFGPALFLLFLGLKLTGHIDWSWWWVTAPLWIGMIPMIILMAAFILFGPVKRIVGKRSPHNRRF